MNFRYYILPDLNLIIESYIGEFEYNDIFECKKKEFKNPDWLGHFNVLADIRKAKINLKDYDLVNLNKYLEDNQKINAARKSAILTDNPDQVVFGTLLKGYNLENSLIIPEVFSTVKAALSWLGIDKNETERIAEIITQISGDI